MNGCREIVPFGVGLWSRKDLALLLSAFLAFGVMGSFIWTQVQSSWQHQHLSHAIRSAHHTLINCKAPPPPLCTGSGSPFEAAKGGRSMGAWSRASLQCRSGTRGFPRGRAQQFVNRRHAKWKEIATVCLWFAFYAWQQRKKRKKRGNWLKKNKQVKMEENSDKKPKESREKCRKGTPRKCSHLHEL